MGRGRRSTYIEVEVEIDILDHIDQFETDDLMDELIGRDLSTEEMLYLNSGLNLSADLSKTTVMDEIKIKIVIDNYSSKTIEELDNFFKDN